MKRITRFPFSAAAAAFLAALLFASGVPTLLLGQTQRNPVLEFCTGTWCQWCPCGDDVVHSILASHPNTIVLAYHGPTGAGDPFANFSGNSIINALGFNAYPTGIVDRVTGIINRNIWLQQISNRAAIPATVGMTMKRKYDRTTRKFTATVDFTALQNLNGEYRWNAILVEDGQVYPQTSNNTCTPGRTSLPNYVHEWTVRAMMNGALGQQLVNGTWMQNQTLSQTLEYTVPGGTPAIVPEKCTVVVKVYKVGSSLAANSEIQQAQRWPLLSDYEAQFAANTKEALGPSSAPASFPATLTNSGLLPDTYTLNLEFAGPTGWAASFTSPNGTFAPGQSDALTLAAGQSATLTVNVNANAINGMGLARLRFSSANVAAEQLEFRFTTLGLDLLLVDDEEGNYESFMMSPLEQSGQKYGVISSRLLPPAGDDLYSFQSIFWMTALSRPGLTPAEQEQLKAYLDHGGRLYLNGLDLAYQLGDSTSRYYSAASREFLTKYLHAAYVQRNGTPAVVEGIAGDPISESLPLLFLTGGTGASTVNPDQDRFANQITPAGPYSHAIFNFFQMPQAFAGIRAVHYGTHGTGRVVFTTFGFETIDGAQDRKLLFDKIAAWLALPTGVAAPGEAGQVYHFELAANYPNPFNPETRIVYTLPTGARALATLVVISQLGQTVRTLVEQEQGGGRYQVTWDGRDDRGQRVRSGVYFYRLRHGNLQEARKMVLLH
ncbi:MAG: Omp28-related outer membrane protein [candidate division KSB1 bacterium]|nr:Omp28-related outer membrane protein [candidate division KSB1 bacterium]MDZ7275416.1 Omp28-related outer membrane protein [candidate division KSB1 bacterium]MDZ7286272.1 Omp28-related outer membrane protein [candidate division KSB1 bacterium]MDZ7296498.1 Omp28-related outer membrane protein [candidate division KSB1 bacterium]MDZ7305544.1 Omp28-related outer membrane protein [candidate division KSB1 bacterium]